MNGFVKSPANYVGIRTGLREYCVKMNLRFLPSHMFSCDVLGLEPSKHLLLIFEMNLVVVLVLVPVGMMVHGS